MRRYRTVTNVGCVVTRLFRTLDISGDTGLVGGESLVCSTLSRFEILLCLFENDNIFSTRQKKHDAPCGPVLARDDRVISQYSGVTLFSCVQ